jgi:Tol biopolymer transport system component
MGTYHKNALPNGYQLAEYAIEAVLGHGGFGITYLARDTSLGALVAIKEFLPGEIAQRDVNMKVLPNPERQAVRDYQAGLKNFVKEARALAHFKHPHIVRVLRFLEANGTAYTVMEYEEGQSLADYLKQHGPRLDEQMILRVFIPILNGLNAVHEAKMLHLDIKPENIYLRKDGNPVLIDFGSARRAMTETKNVQRIALTHGYAPMEQYPEKGTPGAWTDVYALGASMYRCISGKRPEDALSRYQAVLKYQADPLTPATKIGAKHYQPMLLECIDWALQIYPKDRPQTARELQDGLMGKRRQSAPTAAARLNPLAAPKVATITPVAARAAVRRSQWRGTVRTIIGTGRMLLLMAVIGGALVGTSLYWKEIQAWLASAGDNALRNSAPAPQAPSAAGEYTLSDPAPTRTATTTAPATAKVPAALPAALPALTVPERTLSGHRDWVQAVAFSPDGRWLASGSSDRSIRVWDVANGTVLGTLRGHEGGINAIAYSSDGKWLVSAGDDGALRLWDGVTGGQRGVLRGQGGSLFALAISPDGKTLVAGGKDQVVMVWDIESGKRQLTLEGHRGDIFALAISPDGKTIASSGKDKTIRLWNRKTGEELSALSGHKDAVLSLAFSPDGRSLASGDAGRSLRLWDAKTLAHQRTLTNLESSILSLAFSPDSYWLAVGLADKDKSMVLLEGEERVLAYTLSAHQDFVQAVAFAPSGRMLASGSRDKNIRLWRARQ